MLYDIPGWPPYKVRSDDLQVISYHYQKSGYTLKRLNANRIYDRSEEGFNLCYKGKRKFIGVMELRKIVNQNEGRSKMPYASQKGGLKSGDLIIGSVTKNSNAVSFAIDPAVHSNMTLAKAEAARLATVDKTKKFVVVEVKAVASVNDIVWE